MFSNYKCQEYFSRGKISGFYKKIIVFLTTLSLITAVPLAAKEKSAAYPPLLIGPGDQLRIIVFNHTSNASQIGISNYALPTDYLVDSDGNIYFPFIGTVKVSSLTQAQVCKLFGRGLKEFIKFPQVAVMIQQSNNYNVSVLGQVGRPGKYLIRGQPTLLSVLAEVGGPLESADLGEVLLMHNGQKSKINLNLYLKDKSFHGKEPVLFPGDLLLVPKNPWPNLGEMLGIAGGIISTVTLVYFALNK